MTQPDERENPDNPPNPPPPEDDERLDLSGTLFVMVVFLMLIFGGWIMIFIKLLER